MLQSYIAPMLRLIVALLLGLALLANPAAVSAAVEACPMQHAAEHVVPGSNPVPESQVVAKMDCCNDHGGDLTSQEECARDCAAMCVAPAMINAALFPVPVRGQGAPGRALNATEPLSILEPRLERPPRIFAA